MPVLLHPGGAAVVDQPIDVQQAIAAAWPPDSWRDVNVLAAVSGGADSVALLRALVELKTGGEGALHAAHLNHALRGAQSDADEQFVRDLCAKLLVPLHVDRADVVTAAQLAGDGLEAAARAARYEFFQRAAGQCGARFVATAHTADDQVETILHRLLRGTGVAGLAGMAAARELAAGVTLIRPLLDVRREDVLAYLERRGQTFREDVSNEDPRFTRNRLRGDLLPKLRAEYNPAVDRALLRLGTLAGECQSVIDGLLAQLDERAHVEVAEEGELRIGCSALRGQPPYLVREWLIRLWQAHGFPQQAMGRAEWRALAEMIAAPEDEAVPPRDLPGGIRATKEGDRLALAHP